MKIVLEQLKEDLELSKNKIAEYEKIGYDNLKNYFQGRADVLKYVIAYFELGLLPRNITGIWRKYDL